MRGTACNRRPFKLPMIRQLARSINIKLVHCFCIVLTLIVLASRSTYIMGLTHHTTYQYSVLRGRYAILINTWKRNDLLKKSISHYATCSGVDSIHVVWSEPNPPPASLKKFLQNIVQTKSLDGRPVEMKFDFNNEDTLNNRFKEIKDLKADAVFSVDDDVIFRCSTVEFAFSVWQNAMDTMVGFVPRAHWLNPPDSNVGGYKYGGWWSVWWSGTYSMVLSKAAFFHKKYLSLYTNEMPASIRNYVARNRNCEDIAMSFLIANASGSPPIWVKGKINEIGSSGISSLGGHSERRSECLNWFFSEYGRMPLVSTSVKAVDSRRTWFW